MSFIRPTLSQLVERVRSDIETRMPGADSRLRHSLLDVLARVEAGAVAGLYGYLDYLARMLMPDTAEAEYLARWASIWGVRRKAAIAAEATVTVTGTNGSVIAAGVQLARSDGALYEVSAAATVSAGTAAVSVTAIEAGAAGDLLPGTELTFTSPVAGVNAAAVVASAEVAGAAEEADESLLARLLSRIQTPPQGGAANDYVAWALAQPGVTRAWVYPGWMGTGTVGLTFVMDGRENILPLSEDVTAVQTALDLLRPVTAELVVFAPAAEAIDFVVRLIPDTVATRAAVEAELTDFFARDAEPGGTIYRSRASEAISLAEGEFRHAIDLPERDYTAAAGAMPMLGTVTFAA